jgi:hypothetical protein
MSSHESAASRRPWIVLLYFYLAAIIGLGFVIAGTTTALFGAKEAVVPELGISSPSSYDSSLRRDAQGNVVATDAERAAARRQAVDDRRREGLDGMVNGLILLVVGLPTLVWHLRRARRVGPVPDGSRPPASDPPPPPGDGGP